MHCVIDIHDIAFQGSTTSNFHDNSSKISDIPLLDERASHIRHISLIHGGLERIGPLHLWRQQSINVERKPQFFRIPGQKNTLTKSRRLKHRKNMLNVSRKRHLRVEYR
ncbi:hypothetical protein WS83_24375 [Burkholderia sp. MSMB2042]|nr:hypothetical protein WS78_29815 [Burkholderia savannae]KVG44906.1 hypothetical protein WS77_06930 [Burkholderia sp. MSMB0265]KVG89893.1 hypothetical protein WS81_19165 [Burkholderia sp. MSMB2040]KVG96031.1 hypothetical protein WS82_02340 [Burkholderia sp. MSMB2041]KVG99658.1 hypothetical protein WS83_24375 [Burkholderia sp. MSMB2042]